MVEMLELQKVVSMVAKSVRWLVGRMAERMDETTVAMLVAT